MSFPIFKLLLLLLLLCHFAIKLCEFCIYLVCLTLIGHNICTHFLQFHRLTFLFSSRMAAFAVQEIFNLL